MTTRTTASLLLAGLLAAGGAFAQNSATPTTDTATGEVTTMTNGQPNAATTNNPPMADPSTSGAMGAGPAVVAVPAPAVVLVPAETAVMPASPRTRRAVPVVRSATGEASTYVGGQFNANPDDPRLQ
jgi:hypothetical protein